MAASWAAIAKAEPPKQAAKVEQGEKTRVAVVDANALITGAGLLDLVRFADRCVTTPEVLREVRDKQSRQALAALPFTIETQEPGEDSVKAIVRFARATGDVHALSAADVRLLALTHSLEVAAHGAGHLRELPVQAKVQKKRVHDAKALPGWGAEGGDWAEMDRLNEEELDAAEAALMANSESRIAQGIQQLSLGEPEEAGASAGSDAQGEGDAAGASGGEGGSGAGDEEDEESGSDSDEGQEGGDGDSEWQTAARTHNVARRQRRRALRRAAREAEEAELAAQAAEEEGEWEEASSSGSEGEEAEEGEEGSSAGAAAAFESSVSVITADFAMQNVALQMGLRLVAPDGRRITRLSKWVLRCTACFQVTKEMGRLFCPRCGNATLDKVQVTVGPDGAEQYGVKKKHILRGTKFSLPKPRGGRARDVILREDQLLAKAHRLRKKKSAQAELDPFAPEYGQTDAWFQAAALPNASKGAAVLLAGWKHNPNERKHVATNRRRK